MPTPTPGPRSATTSVGLSGTACSRSRRGAAVWLRRGLEAAARRLRHAVFAGCDADWLALAHHRDDQAETILFRLLRGAGVSGAAGMPAERLQAGGPRLIRPLLDLPRSLLAAYAEENSLAWVEDESNADSRYRRNHLRRQVMPRIEERFPGAAQVLARAGRHFAEAALLLEELAKIDRAAAVGVQGRIDLARFKMLSKARAGNLLRSELLAAGFRPRRRAGLTRRCGNWQLSARVRNLRRHARRRSPCLSG
ncbi:MAG: tRNA lysidine(34) synthetase TilS [Candidatus Accumulibacter propinquus]